MNMGYNDVGVFFNEIKEMHEKKSWLIYPCRRKEINQKLLAKEPDALLGFYQSMIDLVFTKEDKIKFEKLMKIASEYNDVIRCMYEAALKGLTPEVQSLYFEYDCDGASFYFCDSYDSDSEDWASSYIKCSDEIDMSELFQFYEWEFDSLKEELCRLYLDAYLLNVLSECWILDPTRIPIGFAEHDFPIVVLGNEG